MMGLAAGASLFVMLLLHACMSVKPGLGFACVAVLGLLSLAPSGKRGDQ